MSMFNSFWKNIKISVGIIALFHLLLISNRGMGMEINSVSNKQNLLYQNHYNLLSSSTAHNVNSTVEYLRNRRKYGRNETTYALIVFDDIVTSFNYTPYHFIPDHKQHLSGPTFSLCLLRGPPIV